MTQEQVAERMNVSIHTYRPWDQGKRRPARLEQVQLLALIVEAPIDVIWPATDDPLVAEALRLERHREMASGELPRRSRPRNDERPDEVEPDEIRVRRLEKAPVGSSSAAELTHEAEVVPETGADVDEPGSVSGLGGLPPWPDEIVEELSGDLIPTDSEVEAVGFGGGEHEGRQPETHEPVRERPVVDHDGAVTLRASGPAPGRRLKHVVVALAAALALGGVGTVVAGALGERPADADPSAQTAPLETAERARVEARARDVATMRAAADRGDYDAAITQARQLDDAAAMSGYRESAARVLVGRADKAARRGDLSLARSRLRAAKRRYGIAPGATAVQARVRRIERQRKERAQRQRAAARRATVAQQRAAANAARASQPSVSNAPAPSTSSAPQSSAPAPSTSSPSKGSGGGSGAKQDPEEAVDPGLF